MLPSFDIYLSVLTDAWMPWLRENRREKKFEALVRLTGSAFRGDYPAFFTALVQALQKQPSGSSEKIMKECTYFSALRMSLTAKRMKEAFITQSVQSSREYFYQVLTGMCLGASYDGIQGFFRHCEGPEIKAYYLDKLLSDLHSMLHLPIPHSSCSAEEEKIALQVKVALAILMKQLLRKQGKPDGNMLAYFDVHGWLGECLEHTQFQQQKEDLLRIFEQCSEEGALPSEMRPAKAESNTSGPVPDKQESPVSIPIPEFVELQQDLSEIREDLFRLLSAGPLPPKKEESAETWMTSKEVCTYLKISKSTLQRKRKKGEIPYFVLAGKCRYKKKDIRALLTLQDPDQVSGGRKEKEGA